MICVGIDFSLTCPCLTIFEDNQDFFFKNCQIHFLTSKKKHIGAFNNILGEEHLDFISPDQRHDNLCNWLLSKLENYNIKELKIALEGYSYNSSGRVNDISEATGLIKNQFYKRGIKYDLIPPTRVKKFAYGKGNATKLQMLEVFKRETNLDLCFELNCIEGNSPVSDIIDSYYLCKYLLEDK